MTDLSALRARLRQRLASDKILLAPGVFDGLSARLTEEAGFEAIYASGGAIARSAGFPDLGLLTLTEMLDRITQITQAVNVPVIADADTGYGNALSVQRTVRLYEHAGVAALHIEDQVSPKRCGHYEGQALVPVDEMVGKVRAALEARHDSNVLIIARTDARSVVGLDEALKRAREYAAAGADLLFVEAPRSVEELKAIAEVVPVPLVYNMTYSGKSPVLTPAELAALGYRLMIYPADLQLGAIRGMQRVLVALNEKGMTESDDRVSFQDREAVVRLAEYLARATRYAGGSEAS